jgi:peptidoglycan/LPS O-acetylase OafA/YrhL
MLLFAIFSLVALWQALRPSWLMRNSVMQYIGERSFSMYLVQFGVIHVMLPIYPWLLSVMHVSTALTLLISYVITAFAVILVASVTYRFIEVPGVNLGRRIIQAQRTRQLSLESSS